MDETLETVEVNDPELLQLVDATRRSSSSAPDSGSAKGRSGIRGSNASISATCRATSAAGGAREGVVEVRNPSNKCNGMTYDARRQPLRLRARHQLAGHGNACR